MEGSGDISWRLGAELVTARQEVQEKSKEIYGCSKSGHGAGEKTMQKRERERVKRTTGRRRDY